MTELPTKQEGYDFSGDDELDRERQEAVERLSRGLLGDFYQTFRLSQGEAGPQRSLMYLLSIEHQLSGHQSIMAEGLEAARDGLDRLTTPAHHVETSVNARQYRDTGFPRMWSDYEDVLQNPNVREHPNELKQENEYTIYSALRTILQQELKYQDKGRPNRTGGSDPYESIVREYIFGDRLTGSDQLKAVRDELREYLSDLPSKVYGDRLSEQFQSLIDKWQTKHPGESFLPEAETTNSGMPG